MPFDPECGAHWCPECLPENSRELTINCLLCTEGRLVLQCKACLHEEVYLKEAKNGKG